jgi:hypothetical protein
MEYMKENYLYWIDTYKNLYIYKKWKMQEELNPIEDETRKSIGFYRSQGAETKFIEIAPQRYK